MCNLYSIGTNQEAISPSAHSLCRLARKSNLAAALRQNNPTGKSLLIFGNGVKSQIQKYSAFAVGQIRGTIRPSHPMRGALRTSRTRGGMRWTRMLRLDERGRCGRRSRVVLAPRWWRQVPWKQALLGDDGGKKPVHRGELDISRKPSRRESRDASAEPVCSCAFSLCKSHARPRVQRCTRLSLRPPLLGGSTGRRPRTLHAARSRKCGQSSSQQTTPRTSKRLRCATGHSPAAGLPTGRLKA